MKMVIVRDPFFKFKNVEVLNTKPISKILL